jgi:hypothetical protein
VRRARKALKKKDADQLVSRLWQPMERCAPKQPWSEKKTDAQAKNGSAKQQHLRNFLAIPNSNSLHLSSAKL